VLEAAACRPDRQPPSEDAAAVLVRAIRRAMASRVKLGQRLRPVRLPGGRHLRFAARLVAQGVTMHELPRSAPHMSRKRGSGTEIYMFKEANEGGLLTANS
jgi:hypothetical protein